MTSFSGDSCWVSAEKSRCWYHHLFGHILRRGIVPKHVAFIMDGNRTFAKKNSLQTLTIHQKGYGLLGPSGCGKTTLINCLIGQMKLDSGTIEMGTGIAKHSDIGYMPQTVSIYEYLTVYENISFFGFLIGMSENDVRAKVNELTSWLEIPSVDRIVSTLSGGQQRCVSLAITFLHDPKLLILDEPTVGMDPVLSQCIWDQLLKLTATGKSIIITTHYIQEARRAHRIGFLREGVLLVEDVPDSLMERCGCENLEETFLKLCKERTEKITKENNNTIDVSRRSQQPISAEIRFDDRSLFSVRRFRALIYKDVILRKRNILFELLFVLLPLMQIALCNYAVGVKPKNLKIAVVNEESTCTYRSYNHSCFLDTNATSILSCMYLDELRRHSYDLITYGDLNTSLKEISERQEDAWALLHFNENFSRNFAHRIDSSEMLTEREITDSFFEVWVDYSNQYIGVFIRSDVIKSILPFLQKAYTNCNLSPKLANTLTGVNFQPPIYGSEDTQFNVYSMMAQISLMSMFFPSLAAGMYSQFDRISGIIERMFVSGATAAEILLSVASVQFVIHILQTVLNLVLAFPILSNPLQGSWIDFASLQLLVGSMGALQGICLSLITDQIMFLGVMQIGVNLMLSLALGLIWPMEAAHDLIKIVNQYFLPLSDTVSAARGIALKKYDLSDFVVLKGHISIVIWHLVFLLQIIAIIKIRKNLFLGKIVRN